MLHCCAMLRLQYISFTIALFACLPSWSVDIVSVAAGTGDHALSSYRIAVKWDWDSRWLEGKNYYLTGNWVVNTSYLLQDEEPSPMDQGPKDILTIGVSPIARLQLTNDNWPVQPYFEIGVGVAYLSHKSIRTGERRSLELGSNFQFEDRLSVGTQFGAKKDWEVALHAIHYSNANLASVNKGVNAYLVMLSKHL